MQISGEFSPRSGRILSHFRSEKLLKIGAFAVASVRAVASGSAARSLTTKLVNAATVIARYNFGFIEITIQLDFRQRQQPCDVDRFGISAVYAQSEVTVL